MSRLPRRLDDRERHLDHGVEIGDRDPLVRRMDVGHPVREIHAGKAALVEDVRVGGPPENAVVGS